MGQRSAWSVILLDVWLYGTRLARIEVERRSRMRLSYTDDAIERWGLGSRVFTVAAPITATTLTPGPTSAIVEGLLPEGDALAVLTDMFGSRESLLLELGRETIGAVVIVEAGGDLPEHDPHEVPKLLSQDDIAARIRGLPGAPLGVSSDTNVRLSLAGAQPKLPLAFVDGRYVDPTYSTPSTVILKPEPGAWPGLVDLEAWGLSVMRAAGVPTPEWEIEEFNGIRTLVVHRYDRVIGGCAHHRRIHQEDLCMALGIRPEEKYAVSHRSRSSLSRMASVVYENSSHPKEDLQKFVSTLVVNVAIGNADAHARNLSLLHEPDGTVRLAPAYDVIPTYHYSSHSRHLAQTVNRNVLRPESVTGTHLFAEVLSWGVPRARATLEEAVSRTESAIEEMDLPLESTELQALLTSFRRLHL